MKQNLKYWCRHGYPGYPSSALPDYLNTFSCLDGSTIYGSSKDEAEELRTFVRGKLRVQTDGKHEELLPADTNDLDCRMSNGFSCFKSGDVRVNEHPSLVGKCGCCALCVNFDDTGI